MLCQAFKGVLATLLTRSVIAVIDTYREDTALEYVRLAGAAYCSNKSLVDWNCRQCQTTNVSNVQICESSVDKTRAFVGRWKGDCLLSFEGTESLFSMGTDLEIYKSAPERIWDGCEGKCTVHGGYQKTWMKLQVCLLARLSDIGCVAGHDQLRVTGHSMGAGGSAIAMMALEVEGWGIREAYNFGMPRTGNFRFADTFTKQFAGRFWRVTHHKDIIIQIPPRTWNYSWTYQHVGHESFYNGPVNDTASSEDNDIDRSYRLCRSPEDMNCSKRYWDVLDDNWNMSDHLHYMDIALGVGACGNVSETPAAVLSQVEAALVV